MSDDGRVDAMCDGRGLVNFSKAFSQWDTYGVGFPLLAGQAVFWPQKMNKEINIIAIKGNAKHS